MVHPLHCRRQWPPLGRAMRVRQPKGAKAMAGSPEAATLRTQPLAVLLMAFVAAKP
jgi:hypothetical protein